MARSITAMTSQEWDKDRQLIDDPLIGLITVTMPGVPGSPFRGVPNRSSIQSNGFLYSQWSLQFSIPDLADNLDPEVQFVISNVEGDLVPYLNVAQVPNDWTVSLALIREGDPDTEILAFELDITGVTVDKNAIYLQSGLNPAYRQAFSRIRYNQRTSPGLFD